jgi:hypothetical protein
LGGDSADDALRDTYVGNLVEARFRVHHAAIRDYHGERLGAGFSVRLRRSQHERGYCWNDTAKKGV